MANFRTTADLVDGVLQRSGEVPSSVGTPNPTRQAQALLYLNQIHHNLVIGGSELNIDVDEPWTWARSRRPIILKLNPAITTGSVSLTYGSVGGTFSSAPQLVGSNISVEGWHIKPDNCPEIYKIAQHTSGSTSFQLDAPFPQNTASNTFRMFQLDYNLITSTLIVDSQNDTLDFIESGTTVLSASVPHGAYTQAALATAVATALNAAGTHTNTYSCTYDTNQRLFTVSSNLGGTGSPVFQPQGASPNSYRSCWELIGFDYTNFTGASSYTSLYADSTVVRFSQAARIFFGNTMFWDNQTGQMSLLDPVAFDRTYPLVDIQAGAPDSFTILHEKNNYTLTIRLNKYPMSNTNVQSMRVEFEHMPEPKDLYNNQYSVPKIPRKYIRILEYGAAYYLLKDKSDSKASEYLQIAQQTLQGMMKSNRKELEKAGTNFGNVIARPDLMPQNRKRRPNIYGYDSQE